MRDEEIICGEISINAISKIAKGAFFVFMGSVVGMIVAFATRLLIARNYTPKEYGVFSLGYVILFIGTVIATLGFQEGLSREIAYYMGKKDNEKISNIIVASLLFSILSGVTIFIIIFLFSDTLSKIFKIPELTLSLKLLSVAIPFFVLTSVLTAIFRGFGSIKEKVFFSDILKNFLFLMFVIYAIHSKLIFLNIITFYSLSIILTSIAFILYFINKSKNFGINFNKFDILSGKEVLFFSIPLFMVNILNQLMNWTDTITIGYFEGANPVGLYNAALPLGQFISIALGSILFLYMPMASELYARKKLHEIKRSYIILTKWLTAITLPLATIFIFFPKATLLLLLGAEYTGASNVLQILSVGFFINNLMGPNGATLIAMGQTRFIMYVTFSAAIINISLNIILVPLYGINGAAVATVTILALINVIRSIKLYLISKIHSLEKNIIKPMILSIILVSIIYFIAKNFLTITFWMLPILFIAFLILYGFSLLFTKSFDKEDLEMLYSLKTNLKKFLNNKKMVN